MNESNKNCNVRVFGLFAARDEMKVEDTEGDFFRISSTTFSRNFYSTDAQAVAL